MKIKHFKIYTLVLVSIMVLVGCNEEFLDINENPNVASEGAASLLLAAAEANIGAEFSTGLGFGASVNSRQLYALAASTYAITGATYQQDWESLYSRSLKDLDEIIATGEATENYGYQGIGKILTAYTYHQLVDFFGDIPYSEALDGENNIAPAFDDDAAIYDALLISLDEAIVNLDTAISRGDLIEGDVMYGGSYANWIAAANTLKLKMYLNLSNVEPARAATGINAIIADGRIIDTAAEDWQILFNSTQVPNNRHPFYNSQYDTGPGYLDNYIMLSMVQDTDPRLRFYFYRQARYSDLDFQTTPCSSRTDCDTWTALQATGLNYIGRDHGDPSGLPGDDNLVTVPGIYPVGGKYDDSSYRTVNANSTNALNYGAEGAGIMPLFTSSMTHFMLAEAALNVPGVTTPLTASAHFAAGMQASFDKVRTFAMSFTATGAETSRIEAFETANSIDWDTNVANYVTQRTTDFDGATGNDQLNILMAQKNRANWGNGMESYTDLRRTGFPDMPASLAPQGPFPARFLYPDSEIAGNPNAPDVAIPQSTPIFWDN